MASSNTLLVCICPDMRGEPSLYGHKYWAIPCNLQIQVFSVTLSQVHKIKLFAIQSAFTDIC